MSARAALFYRGPRRLAGARDDQTVILTGMADPGQAGCKIGFAVPYRKSQQGDWLVPVLPDGSVVPPVKAAEGKAFPVRVDRTVSFEAPLSWWSGADGLLPVLLYDIDLGEPGWKAWLQFLLEMQLAEARVTGDGTRPPPVPSDAADALVELFKRPSQELLLGAVKTPPGRNAAAAVARERNVTALGRERQPVEAAEFVLASCQYPAGMLDRDPARASYRRIGKRFAAGGTAPDFVLLVGDQYYTDATAGLFDPTRLTDRFEAPYLEFLDLLKELRDNWVLIYTMLDDHEIEDNWEPPRGGLVDPLLVAGRDVYKKQRRSELGPALRTDYENALWYIPDDAGVRLFVADTRTERQRRTAATVGAAQIMRPEQFEELCNWLKTQPPEVPKFVASPSILLPRRLRAACDPASALRSDAWEGYPASLHALLACIADNGIGNVVFLSGDEHLSCVAQIELKAPGKPAVRVASIHSSALYAPFPFANADEADFKERDCFSFAHGGETNYTCTVSTTFVPGDGFAVIRIRRDGAAWKVECEFDRAGGPSKPTPVPL